MKTARLGSFDVSVIGLGCNNLGRALDRSQSEVVVNAALDAGITYFDTASNYGEGQSESFLGGALGSRRDDVVISTKFGMPVPGWENSGGASPGYLRQAVERSLRELGTEHIDLLMIHFPDPKTPIGDTLLAMNELVEAGKVREVGCSNFNADQLRDAVTVSSDLGLTPIVCDQVHYSLMHRDPESDGTMETCHGLGIALLPYYPLGSGLLTGKARRGETPTGRLASKRYKDFLSDENFDLVESIETYASERGVSMVQVALGWLLSREDVPTVTAGATKPSQIESNVTAADWTPTAEDLEALEELLG
ncbi:MAG TPA: aldo/keto reductase [Acidimicrobiia bacterium]|nr:aldo/keto reductase [Acidimicrobiia bacterium]